MGMFSLLFAPGLTPTRLRAETMRAKRIAGVDILFLDYIQLMRVHGLGRYDEVTAVSHELNELAMSLRIPVIALSQLRREVEQQGRVSGKELVEDDVEMREPRLSDLRNSGDIEQDAYGVFLLHRPTLKSTSGKLIGAKLRDGASGWRIALSFDMDRMLFKEA
jgi:replicative DNA helicase